MSVQDQIDRIAGAKSTLGAYLAQNGVPVPTGATLDKMALQLADVIEKQNKITAAGILKGDGAGGVSAATPGKDYLTEAPVTSVNGATGKVKSTFYVTVTQGADGSVTADKTLEEIYTAYESGYSVYAKTATVPQVIVPLTLATHSGNNYVVAFNGATNFGETIEVVIANDGSGWEVFSQYIALKTDIPDIPAVTAADNGKFLRVVNGAWAAVEIANANGGSF